MYSSKGTTRSSMALGSVVDGAVSTVTSPACNCLQTLLSALALQLDYNSTLRSVLVIALVVASVVSTRRFAGFQLLGFAHQKTVEFKSLGLASQAVVRARGGRPHFSGYLARVRLEQYRLQFPRSRNSRAPLLAMRPPRRPRSTALLCPCLGSGVTS